MGMETLVDKQDLHGWVKPLRWEKVLPPFWESASTIEGTS